MGICKLDHRLDELSGVAFDIAHRASIEGFVDIIDHFHTGVLVVRQEGCDGDKTADSVIPFAHFMAKILVYFAHLGFGFPKNYSRGRGPVSAHGGTIFDGSAGAWPAEVSEVIFERNAR